MSGDTPGGKLVDVYHDARWWPGYVEAWRSKEGRWQVYVRFGVGGGVSHNTWVDADDVRPAGVEVRVSEWHRRVLATVETPPEAPFQGSDGVAEQGRRRTGVRALVTGSAVAALFAILASVGMWLGSQEGEAGSTRVPAAQQVAEAPATPSTQHGHHGPAMATEEQPSPASRASGAVDTADVTGVLASCERRWRRQEGPQRAAQASLNQWRVHIVAMNRLVSGKITLAQANAFWDKTRFRALRNVERFAHAYTRYEADAAGCAWPRGADAASSRDAGRLRTCIEAAHAGDRVLALAGRAIATWEHHVHDMLMLESGQLTPAKATRRWLAKWRVGNRQLTHYERTADLARAQRCS
jgi:hypothetical protein